MARVAPAMKELEGESTTEPPAADAPPPASAPAEGKGPISPPDKLPALRDMVLPPKRETDGSLQHLSAHVAESELGSDDGAEEDFDVCAPIDGVDVRFFSEGFGLQVYRDGNGLPEWQEVRADTRWVLQRMMAGGGGPAAQRASRAKSELYATYKHWLLMLCKENARALIKTPEGSKPAILNWCGAAVPPRGCGGSGGALIGTRGRPSRWWRGRTRTSRRWARSTATWSCS